MKRLLLLLQQLRAQRRIRRWLRPAPSAGAEMHRGSLIGFVVCLVCAFAINGHPGPVLWAALLGAGFGALTGLLLWVGSDRFGDQAVIPPQRTRWRVEHDSAAGWPARYASGRHPVRPYRQRPR